MLALSLHEMASCRSFTCSMSVTLPNPPQQQRFQIKLLNLLCPFFTNNYNLGHEITEEPGLISRMCSSKCMQRASPTLVNKSIHLWGQLDRLLWPAETVLEDTDIISYSTRVACTQAEPRCGKGRALYCDRLYRSPKLASELIKQGTLRTGTVMTYRKGLTISHQRFLLPL